MNNEQFEKLYQLLTGCCVGIFITMIFVFLICGIYFINTYYEYKERQDKIKIIKNDEKLRDKLYLSDLEHRLRKLENKDN